MNPLSTSRNKYHDNIKNSTVFTPLGVCNFIYDIVSESSLFQRFEDYEWVLRVLDPAVGTGNLFSPFCERMGIGVKTFGMDIEDHEGRQYCDSFCLNSFLEEDNYPVFDIPDLVIMNPPFNTDIRNKDWLKKNKMGKALLPEVFLDKVFKRWGLETPVVMITPMGFRLNQRIHSKRWRKFSKIPVEISSIASLPLNIFPTVEFHVEILFWNLPGLKPHYWFREEYLEV